MADPKRVGRVFCVTGYNQDESLAFITNVGKNSRTHIDTESNSSGYSSSSSIEYSDEEKRILPNDQKVFQIWEQLSQHTHVPQSSTPKLSSAVSRVTGSTKNLLAIRKTFGKRIVSQQTYSRTNRTIKENDSFWDIELPERQNACKADGNIPNQSCERTFSSIHDAGLEIHKTSRSLKAERKTTSNDWGRRPLLGSSYSDTDIRKCGKARKHSGSTSDSNISEYNSLPRYTVKLESDNDVAPKIVKRLTEEHRDRNDEGVPVDKSMTEFISIVDKDNLVGILQFYDHVTTESALRMKQKSRYESLYF